jgi:hypothetical protein
MNKYIDYNKMINNEFYKVELDNTICADGSEYYVLLRKANSNKLLIFLQGGGACWDSRTATTVYPIDTIGDIRFLLSKNYKRLQSYRYKINVSKSKISCGIFEFDNELNPFKDYNILFIPYSTGDLHLGTTEHTYTTKNGNEKKLYHHGYLNVMAALNFIYTIFKQPDKLVLSGSSAGGFASPFIIREVADLYKNCFVYNINDCGYGVANELSFAAKKYWKAPYDYEYRESFVDTAYYELAKKPPKNVKFLFDDTTFDYGLSMYLLMIYDYNFKDPDYLTEFNSYLLNGVKGIDKLGLNFYYYLTEWNKGYYLDKKHESTQHCLLSKKRFYEVEEDQVKYFKWLDDNINKNKSYSIGKKYIDLI